MCLWLVLASVVAIITAAFAGSEYGYKLGTLDAEYRFKKYGRL